MLKNEVSLNFSNQVKIELGEAKDRLDFKRLALREAFLDSGFVSDAEDDYHLEIVCDTEDMAKELKHIAKSFHLKVGISRRNDIFIVYMKDSESIVNFLGIIGASKSVLAFENVRVVKEIRNNVNRAVNCETANLSKVAVAAAEQLRTILFLEKNFGLIRLPKALKSVALARVNAPEASLGELSKQFGISKSGLSKRFQKLKDIAVSLGIEKEKKNEFYKKNV